MPYCMNCGVELKQNADFCNKCGTKAGEGLIQHEAEIEEPHARFQWGILFGYLLAFIICIIVGIFLAALFGGHSIYNTFILVIIFLFLGRLFSAKWSK